METVPGRAGAGVPCPRDPSQDPPLHESRTRPAASIVIVGFGKRAVTEQCLASLEAALGDDLGDRFELVLVDNNSPDDTLELFDRWSDRATVVALPENRNFAGGCNAGAAAATGEILIFLNNDTEVPVGALEALVEQAREPGVGIAGPRLLYPNSRIQHGGVVFKIGSGNPWPFHLFHHEPGDLPAARATFDVDATTGACLVIARELFEDVGGFDEAYVNGLEDVDLCLRVRVAGHRIVYRGDVSLVHHERMTRGASHDEGDNAAIFFRRWLELCDGDDEMIARTFGARFRYYGIIPYAQIRPGHSGVVVGGDVETISAEAAEARALLGLAEAAGLDPALRDAPTPFTAILPVLSDAALQLLETTRMRSPDLDAVQLVVPPGARSQPGSAGAIVRLGEVPRTLAPDWRAIVVPTQELARAVVAAGADPDRVEVLRPPVWDVAVGRGGQGLLVLLPGHDLPRCSRLLSALADLSPAAFLANVRTPALEALVAEHFPSAELITPVTDEGAFAALAGRHDAVLCAAEEDAFERRALIAAAAGSAVVTRAGGPASEVLPDAPAVGAELDADEVRRATAQALSDATPRGDRAALVAAACGPRALGPRLAAIVERHHTVPEGFTLDELAVPRTVEEPLA